MLLETIHSRADLLALTDEQDRALCAEIRQFLIKNVSQTGGHLASNLGVVELTVALHKVFDTSRDRLVFDVGHQCYVHKLLTGRMDGFSSLRQFGGLSGFPKPSESVHDAFVAGHASNSVSVALGMARARTLAGENYSVAALLGDGALTGGLAYEGLNNAGSSREPMIVILNDNGMSITPNVGGISRYLKQVRVRPHYLHFKLRYRTATSRSAFGQTVYKMTHWLKTRLRRGLIGTTVFENLGFTYLGPVDGHDVKRLTELLSLARQMNEPVLLHVMTVKGKGYAPAERMPSDFHGVGHFDPESGKLPPSASQSFSEVFGVRLTELANTDSRICAVTAAMRHGTGLDIFETSHPTRFFDVGIAEGHAVSMAAGMAKQGLLPVVAVYSTFLQRGFDQLLHDIALQKLHVVFGVDRAGLVGEDGETHHGVFDISYLRTVPGMTVFAPASFQELREVMQTAILETEGPVAIRYPRGSEGSYRESGKTLIRAGTDCTLVCYGTLVNPALKAVERCAQSGVSVELLKPCQLAPLDLDPIERSVRKTGRLVVAEEVADAGSLSQQIVSRLAENGVHPAFAALNLESGIVTHGSCAALYQASGLDPDGIFRKIMEVSSHEA